MSCGIYLCFILIWKSRIYVGNYTVYYVVIHKEDKSVMEVRRLLYNGRDRDSLI